jgi:copper chaperone
MSTEFRIEGMSCGGCVASVRRALEAVPGVSVTDVRIGAATVESDGAPATISTIKAALDDAGYAAEVRS